MAKKKKNSVGTTAATVQSNTSIQTSLNQAAIIHQASIPINYTTIADECRIEYVVDKSRFIATAAPCTTEEEVQAFFTRITKEFWDATHNCTAYALGPRQEQQRSSDNGEPSGTAGKPILEVLKKTGITDTAIVVTRYFGGIKLGAGGLIRAYSHSAAEALHQAPKELHAPRTCITIRIDYSLFGGVERYLQEGKYSYEVKFDESVTVILFAELEEVSQLETKLTDICNGRLTWDIGDTIMVAIPVKA